MQGARQAFAVDFHDDRLKLAESIGAEHPALVLDNLVNSVKVHGGIGVVGVYVPQDPDSTKVLLKPGKAA